MIKISCLMMLFFTLSYGYAENLSLDNGLNALRMTMDELLGVIGDDYVEIDPENLGSRADKIIYCPEGITFWFLYGHTAQIRLDSSWAGSVDGISIGMTSEMILEKCGNPWIEAEGSLYYNLPWQGAAVRIRFVFEENKLNEVYLFKVF